MSGYTSYYLYQKYESRGGSTPTPVYPNVYSIDGEGTMPITKKQDDDPECGYAPPVEPTYRWVNLDISRDYICDNCPEPPLHRVVTDGYVCVGYDKHYLNEYQVSTDGGETWYTTSSSTGSLIEENCEDCGWLPPMKLNAKYKITNLAVDNPLYAKYRTYLLECDSSTELTSGDTTPSGYDKGKMYSAFIDDCITTIGDGAFKDFIGLWWVKIPNNVTSIGKYAFYNCHSFGIMGNWEGDSPFEDVVRLPSGITRIEESTFQNCSGFTNIELPYNLTYIGDNAFNYCWNLTGITIPSGVTTIGNSAFKKCGYLTSIDIPDSVTTIGKNAFDECYRLTSCTIGSGVTSIGESAFNYCWHLTGITIPDSVTSIGNDAFSKCSSLSGSISIPDGVTTIGDRTFEYCGSLTSVTIGSGVTSIGDRAFVVCSGITSVDIPDSVTSIGQQAFGYCYSLTSVTIGSGVTEIGFQAFDGCRSLTNIDIPDSVTSIGGMAFDGCRSLSSVTIGSGVTEIVGMAFNNCSSLTSVTIPNSVTSIDHRAFEGCSGLTSITIEATTPPTLGVSVFDDTNNCPIYVPCDYIADYVVEWPTYASRLEPIENDCNPVFTGKFKAEYSGGTTYSAECDSNIALTTATTKPSGYDYKGMLTAEIGYCITYIGDFAFGNCISLTSIGPTGSGASLEIPSGITTIDRSAFYGCSGLLNIDIPDNVTSIGYMTFIYCRSLTSVTIGSGVTSIGRSAFASCSSLTSITINAITPPTLGLEVFDFTNNCPIYVPAESVEAYKAANNWSSYASRIQAIQ